MASGTREPLYLQIKEHFKNLILTNQLSSHDQIPPEREIMEQFNVSRITVTNALTELVKEGWIYRIPGKGSFVQEHIPAIENNEDEPVSEKNHTFELSKPTSKREKIGLVIPTIGDFFALRLMNGIEYALRDTNYSLVMMLSQNSKEKEKEVIRELLDIGVVGLLIFPVDAEIYNEDILALKMRKFPFVLLDRYLPGIDTNYVGSNDILGAKLAVDHLWELGHRKIVICGDSPSTTVTVEDRIRGYIDALTEKGAMINPACIVTDFCVDYSDINKKTPLHDLMKQKDITAFITMNAKLGQYVYRLARSMNRSVPEDVSIVSFDDPYFEDELFSTFTYVQQFEHRMGEEAVKILLQYIEQNGQKQDGYLKKSITPELVVKKTTGVAPSLK